MCTVLKLKRREFLSEQKRLHEILEEKADRAFQGELAAQTRLCEAQSELDRREWQRRNAAFALYDTVRQLESQRMELYQANQLFVQAQREKSWLCEKLNMRSKTFQEDRAKDCQENEELPRICCVEADGARQLKLGEFFTQQKENPSTVNQLVAQIQELQHKVNSLTDARAALGYPTFLLAA